MSTNARIPGATGGRRAALAVAAAIALAPAQASSPAAGADRLTPPRSGATYAGFTAQGRKLTLVISGRAVQVVAFRFRCAAVVASTNLNAIRIQRSATGYRFKISAHSSVSFSDERPDQNAAVEIEGRFSRSARSVAGRLRVRAPRCATRWVTWTARR